MDKSACLFVLPEKWRVDFDVEAFFKDFKNIDLFLIYEGWHHTSKEYNRTNFYSFDDEKAKEKFPAKNSGEGLEFCRNYLEKRKQAAEKKEAAAKAEKEAAEKKESATKKRIVTLWKNGHLPKFKKSLSGKSISGIYGKKFFQIWF